MDRDRYVQIASKISMAIAVLGGIALVATILVPMGLPKGPGDWVLYLLVAATIGPLAGLASGMVVSWLLLRVIGALVEPYFQMKDRAEKAERQLGYRL